MNYEIFNNKFFRKTLASWCAFATLVTTTGPAWAISGALDSGSAALARTSDNVGGSIGGMTGNFNLTSGNAGVLDWSKLSLNNGEALNYNSAGSFYNVVSSAGGMSTIAGAINGVNGANVYIFNPNGIMFNAGSSVDVGGIFGALATGVSGTTLDNWIANPTAVPLAIQNAEMTADITVNGGTIKAAQIALAGLNVSTAEGAKFENKAVLVAGDKVAIDGFGGGTITLTIPTTAWEGDVDMLGQFADNLEAMSAGNVRAANGKLTVDGDLKVNTYGDIDIQPGAFVVNNAEVSAKSIEVTALGDVSVVGKTDLKTTAGDLKLTSQKGQAYVLGTASGDKASIKATGGNLTISADQGILIGENGALFATKKADATKGDVVLTTTGKDVLSDDGIQIAGAKVSADNGITLTAGDGNITIKDSAEVAAASETKTLAITATKGAISEDASSKVAAKGATALTAAATEDITLEGTENDFQGVVAADGAKVSLKDKNSIQLGNITARKILQVDAGQDIKVDNAQVLSAEEMTLTAGGTFEAKNGAVVKAGKINEATLTPEDSKNLTIDAATAKINSGAKVGASGDATVTADALTVNNAKLVAGDTMAIDTKTTDGAGTVTIENGAAVASKGALTIGNAKKPATLTVQGADTKLVSAGALTANAGTITVQNSAKVASDDALALTTADGALVVQSGAKVLAEKQFSLDSNTDMFIDGATVAGKDEVSAKANGTIMAMNNAVVKAGKIDETTLTPEDSKALTIDAANVAINTGAKVAASGATTVKSKILTVDDAALAGGTVEINAKSGVNPMTVSVQNGATVAAYDTLKIGNTPAVLSLTVDGANLIAKGDLEATAGKIDIKNGAKVASDKALTLTANEAMIANLSIDNSQVLSREAMTLKSEEKIAVQNNAVVKAGKINEATLTPEDSKALTIDAANVAINTGAKVGASGDATVTADALTVNNAKLVAGGTMAIDTKTTDGAGAVTIENGAAVASKGALTIGNAKKPATLTVQGADTKLVAAGALTANAGTITAQDNAKVASDDALTLKTTEGALVAQSGAKVLAEKKLALDANTDMFIDGATVAGKDEVSAKANGTIMAMNGAVVKAGKINESTLEPEDSKALTIDAANVAINTGSKVGASGMAKVTADTVTVDAAKLASGGDMAIDMKATDGAGAVTIQNGAAVASKGALTVGGTKKPATLTVNNAQLVSADALTAKASKISVANGAKVASDKALTLMASAVTAGDITVDGSEVLSRETMMLMAVNNIEAKNSAVVKAGTDTQAADLLIAAGEGVTFAKGATIEATRDMMIATDIIGDTAAGVTIQNENTLVTAGNNVTINAKKGDLIVEDKARIEANQEANLYANARDVVIQGGADVQGGKWAQGIAYQGNVKLLDKAALAGGQAGLFAYDGGNVLVDDATIASRTATHLKATPYDTDESGNVTVQNGAKVKAGEFDETTHATTGEVGDMLITAGKAVTIQGASKVGANGAVAISSGTELTVKDENTQVGAKGALSLDAVNAVTIENKAVVAGETTLTVGGTTAPETLTVQGADTKLVSKGALTANAGKMTVQDGAKVASDDALTLKTTEGALVVQSGAKVLAKDGKLTLDSKTDMFINNATVAGKDEVSAKANGTIMAMNNAVVKAGKNLTLDAETITVMSGAKAAASGDVKASAKYTNANGGNFEAGKNIVVDAKAEGEGTVIFENGAVVDAGETLAVGGEKKPERIKIGDATTVSADKNLRLAAAGDTTINSAVTAGKHLTVIGKNVNQNANLTTADGSVYVEATGGDIVMKAGTQTMAKRTTTPNPHTGEGNVLYTATGDVRAEAGGAMISADPDNNDGSAVLTSTTGGSVGENITVNAARSGGAVVDGDIMMHIVGDSELALVSRFGSIALTHENGTLTISKNGIGGNDQVVRVDAVDTTTTIPLSGITPSGMNGLSAKQDITIDGRPDSALVVKSDSGIYAERGMVTIDVDKAIAVDGSVTAGRDAQLVAGGDVRVSGTVQAARDARVTTAGNLSTPGEGKLVAARDLFVTVGSSAPMVNIAVGKGVSARSGERAVAFRTVGGYAYPEVYGNGSKTAVFIDGRVAGGNPADFSILQGYEQVAALGNVQLTPLFSYMMNFNVLGAFIDAQAPGSSYVQANMTSDKGVISEE